MLFKMMIKRKCFFIVDCLISSQRNFARSVSIESNVSLGIQMKKLNDKKQFKSALSLFNAQKQCEMSDLAINQALRACIYLRDFQHGSSIYEQLSPRSLKCHHIQTSLVQLYGELFSLFSKKMIEYSII